MPLRPFGAVMRMPLGSFSTTAPNLREHLEVEVDRAVADAASAEVGDERLAEAVQQRAAEQDRDAAGAGVRVDLGEVGALDVGRVEAQLARSSPLVTLTPCTSSRPRTTRTSLMSGTSRRTLGVSPSSAATIALVTRFFAPLTSMRPRSGFRRGW